MPNKTHIVQPGDTLDLVSTRYYGEPSKSGRILSANPGTNTTLVPGTTLIIPVDRSERAGGNEREGLVVRVGGVAFEHIETISLTRRVDAVDTFTLTAPQADTPEFRKMFRPLSYPEIEVSDGGELLFRGTMLGAKPKLSNEGSSIQVSAYSLPGVLADCMLPESAYPLELRKLNLEEICKKACEPFSVNVDSQVDPGGPFPRVKLRRDNKIMPFLAALAKQRQILLRSNARGDLVLADPPAIGTPVASLSQFEPPITSIEPEFNTGAYHSHVTCLRTTRRGKVGSVHTVSNPLIQGEGVFRPVTLTMSDTTSGELPKATEAAMGRMLAGAVTYTVGLATWTDPGGTAWAPGSTLELEAPDAFVYSPYKFQIRAVRFNRSAKDGDTASLLLMLPGAFGGEPPTVLPWD